MKGVSTVKSFRYPQCVALVGRRSRSALVLWCSLALVPPLSSCLRLSLPVLFSPAGSRGSGPPSSRRWPSTQLCGTASRAHKLTFSGPLYPLASLFSPRLTPSPKPLYFHLSTNCKNNFSDALRTPDGSILTKCKSKNG